MERAGKIIELPMVHKKHIYGSKSVIAIFDTGLASQHIDFSARERVLGFYDVVQERISCYDDSGHGTHVAGIIAGNGRASGGRYRGIAPESRLVIVKVLDRRGYGDVESVLRGIAWVIRNKERYGINVANISVGTGREERYGEDSALVHGVNSLWDAGITVCVAAGNNGPERGSIGAPGNSRKVITVGACDDHEAKINGKTKQNYSGRGPTSCCIKKPDIVAPGSNIISCRSDVGKGGKRGSVYGAFYVAKSGTSMATPMVSGAVALLRSEYPDMTNREVKVRLKNTAVDLGLSHEKQGWGRLHVGNLFLEGKR